MDVSIIIPTLNEEENLPRLLDDVEAEMEERPETYEVIIVDGHSDDRTREIAEDHGTTVITDDGGKGTALREGIAAADGDTVVTMDADLSHKASELGLLIEGIDAGYDVCMGSRFIQGGGTADMPLLRYLGNRTFVALVNLFWRTDFSDLCYGYRSFRREPFQDIALDARGFDIEAELSIKAAKHGLRILEVPSFEKERQNGDAKLRTFADGWNILRTILLEALPGR
ncbi:MAG: glycosyltransferase family 2 protein [Candidatus Nanohaloarchaea archaeon]|nr:glycosyltransferase family 2 protein [Candidatus Nanohaloarchaea archaeon]